MRTEDLIVQLARANRPWRRLPPVRVRATRWMLLAIALAAIVLAWIGPRRDFATAMQNPVFVLLGTLTLAAALAATLSAMTMSVPGAERTPGWRILAVGLALGWAIALVIRLIAGGDPIARLAAFPNHWACVIRMSVVAIPSGIVLFAMLRQAAPLARGWSSALAALAAAAIGVTAAHVMCSVDDPAHHLVSHVLPVALLSAIASAIGPLALARRVQRT